LEDGLTEQNGDGESTEVDREPLPYERIQFMRDIFRESKAKAKDNVLKSQAHTSSLELELHSLKDELSELQPFMKAVCINTRNERSREAIHQDFARGIQG
jgi:uncharacterized coiled-coil DUF342 family protein